jgi:hypothetical protein
VGWDAWGTGGVGWDAMRAQGGVGCDVGAGKALALLP